MSKIKNGGLDQYGAEPIEQQFGTAGVEGVKYVAALLWETAYMSLISKKSQEEPCEAQRVWCTVGE